MNGSYAIDRGVKHTLPGGPLSLLATGLFNLSGKLEAARLLANIGRIDAQSFRSLTVREALGMAAGLENID